MPYNVFHLQHIPAVVPQHSVHILLADRAVGFIDVVHRLHRHGAKLIPTTTHKPPWHVPLDSTQKLQGGFHMLTGKNKLLRF